MFKFLMLCLGGAIGTGARYGLNALVSEQGGKWFSLPTQFPLGTMMINITGCFAIGFLATISDVSLGRAWIKPEWRDFLMIGFCGGYTTFSSYGLQTLNLARDGEWLWAALNVIGSNVVGLAAVYFGRVCGLVLQSKLHGGSM